MNVFLNADFRLVVGRVEKEFISSGRNMREFLHRLAAMAPYESHIGKERDLAFEHIDLALDLARDSWPESPFGGFLELPTTGCSEFWNLFLGSAWVYARLDDNFPKECLREEFELRGLCGKILHDLLYRHVCLAFTQLARGAAECNVLWESLHFSLRFQQTSAGTAPAKRAKNWITKVASLGDSRDKGVRWMGLLLSRHACEDRPIRGEPMIFSIATIVRTILTFKDVCDGMAQAPNIAHPRLLDPFVAYHNALGLKGLCRVYGMAMAMFSAVGDLLRKMTDGPCVPSRFLSHAVFQAAICMWFFFLERKKPLVLHFFL